MKRTKKKTETVLVLRTCSALMTGHGGFKWPEKGMVRAPDWDPTSRCGGGLHGLLWGEGGNHLNWSTEAKWLVVEVLASEIVVIDGDKVKFPRGRVVHVGDQKSATEYLIARLPSGRQFAVHGAIVQAGTRGTATAGYGGTATAGYGGTLAIRWWNGEKYRTALFEVGENGIEPDMPYQVDANGKPIARPDLKKAVSK